MGRIPISVAEEEPIPMMLLWPVLKMKRMETVKTVAKRPHLLRRVPQRKSRNDCQNGQRHVLHLPEEHAMTRLLLMRRMM
jgi:hypothetical protein